MVDVGRKPPTARRAVAAGFVRMSPEALEALAGQRLPKGDALAAARLAGIQAAKRTADLIPLCHPLPLTHARVDLEVDRDRGGIAIRAEVGTVGPTGVEMEALTAVAGAALTLYDMAKALDRGMTIESIVLLEKEGGRSGRYARGETAPTSPGGRRAAGDDDSRARPRRAASRRARR
jgi:cyclic pyranopterin monophosphate synthase